ncbi:hypothetical protein [Methanomassiliicoccus luminyensis]|uniref:hypothetical protein n=1 Tax=Methanomassiliicoccus luminyensis TaxID=1080712 RepID=UPI000474DE66|nr:hypothetical protein [Methanomassiliicoccus luminyensis]
MKRTVPALAVIMTLTMLTVCFSPYSEGATDVQNQKQMNVKNVYCSEFISLGTLPSYEENSYYFFIVGSDNHKEFLRYVNGETSVFLPAHDFAVIQKGDRVAAYFFSSETYANGYEVILEFYNFSGTLFEGYLQLTFEKFVGVDSIQHFFMKGSTAIIKWSTKPAKMTAYFDGENIARLAKYDAETGTYEVTVDIEENGVYPLWFVNDSTNTINATVYYSIEGFESSGSTWIAILSIIMVAAVATLLAMSFVKPRWSKPLAQEGDPLQGDEKENA